METVSSSGLFCLSHKLAFCGVRSVNSFKGSTTVLGPAGLTTHFSLLRCLAVIVIIICSTPRFSCSVLHTRT